MTNKYVALAEEYLRGFTETSTLYRDTVEEFARWLDVRAAEPEAKPPRVFRGNGPDCLGCGKTIAEHLTGYYFCPGLPGDDLNRGGE